MPQQRRPTIVRTLAIVLGLAALPVSARACDYPYMPPPTLYDIATDVFVGVVVESPFVAGMNGEARAKPGDSNRSLDVQFSVRATDKGTPVMRLTVHVSGSSCDYPFIEGQTYLVHARRDNGTLLSAAYDRPLPLPAGVTRAQDVADDPRLSTAMQYVEARAADRAARLRSWRHLLAGAGRSLPAIPGQ